VLAAAAPAQAAPPANADTAAVVTVALGVAVPTLDPGIPAGTPAATVRRHIYEGLVSMTEDGKIVPELASEWTVSRDGLTWTFRLRKGVSFHDGTPFDAAAMKASLDRILDPKEALPNRRYLEAIDRVEAPDPQTVRIVLKEPFGAFLQHLAYDQGFAVSPAALAKHGKDIAKNPVGTGPYRFDSQVSGQSITLTRFPQYRGGQPALAKLIFTTVSEDATRVAQLESGQASVIVNVPPREAVRLGSRKDLAILSKEGNRVAHIGINVTKKPFDDKRVRQALNFAVTKRGVVTGILSGYGAEAQSIVAPSTWGYRAVPIYRYDVGRAKQLLAEAGYPKGRIGRAVLLSLRHEVFVEAAWALGASDLRIVGRHILPNTLAPLAVQSSLLFATAIQSAAGLGFLGLGAQPPTAEWGAMLADSRVHMRVAPMLVAAPGLAIMIATTAFNLLGDGLRDALDVRLRTT
jgi:ABC-type transport system substrate-binding protein